MHAPLQLDARRHAMLKAMGLELWWMPAPPLPSPLAVQEQPGEGVKPPPALRTPPPPVAAPAQKHVPPSVPTVSPLPAEPKPARVQTATAAEPVASVPQRVTLGAWWCQPPVQVFDRAAESPQQGTRWLFVTDDFADAGVDAPQVQQLFHNMLRAMGLFQQAGVWQARMQRAAPDAVADTAVTLEQVAQTLRPQVVVLMGRVAAQTLLQNQQPLGVLRQTPHQVCGMPVLATYSPGYLLHAAHAKAGAWADLRQALRLVQPSRTTR